jgi:hypothetical protein
VMLTTSTDNGTTWSTPVSVDTANGHHFLPAITTDASTGVVHVAYYSTEGDVFNHAVRVLRNQINPGSVSPGVPQVVTPVHDTINNSFSDAILLDLYLGAKARGNSTGSNSRLYFSFDSTTVSGVYEGDPAPDANNTIFQLSF